MGSIDLTTLVAQFPWLLDIFRWLEVAKHIWHNIDGFILLGGLFFIHRRLKTVSNRLHDERRQMATLVDDLGGKLTDLSDKLINLDDKVDERADTVTQLVNAAREAAETMQVATAAQASTEGSIAHWEQLRADWQEMRERIELKIKEVRNRNIRGKYANIDRYSYRDVIVMLGNDALISSQVESALLDMNSKFMSWKTRPNQVSAIQVKEFEDLMSRVGGWLPKVPKPKLGEMPPLPPASRLEAAE